MGWLGGFYLGVHQVATAMVHPLPWTRYDPQAPLFPYTLINDSSSLAGFVVSNFFLILPIAPLLALEAMRRYVVSEKDGKLVQVMISGCVFGWFVLGWPLMHP